MWSGPFLSPTPASTPGPTPAARSRLALGQRVHRDAHQLEHLFLLEPLPDHLQADRCAGDVLGVVYDGLSGKFDPRLLIFPRQRMLHLQISHTSFSSGPRGSYAGLTSTEGSAMVTGKVATDWSEML